MGDLTFVDVPPSTTTTATLPAAAAAAAAEPSSEGGLVAPRCRRVHFPDLVASPIWFPSRDVMAEEADDEPPPPGPGPGRGKATGAAAVLAELEEDRMDMLWEEYFNEELLAMRRRAGGGSCSSDGDESDVSVAGRGAPVGCFPVLRPSARAGGAGHYRRRADTWVLLMRIFRRLFVVDKTVSPPAAARRSATKSAR